MSEHLATVRWQRKSEDFKVETYAREHTWTFPGGSEVQASAAPAYRGDPACVDPEEAFVASLASCHMLTFLAIAAGRRFVVDDYRDEAVGVMEKNAQGRLAITRVVLKPRIEFSGEQTPTAEELAKMHERAHKACFIANSVLTEVVVAAD